MKKKKGISLIVLIVTIIVIIILAAVVILTLSKNNPIESAREATFKEDVRAFQDDLALSISKEYTQKQGQRDEKITTSDFSEIQKYIPSFTEKYKDKFVIENDKLIGTEKLTEKEKEWTETLQVNASAKSSFDAAEWDKTASDDACFIWDGNTIIGYNEEPLSGITTLRIPSKCTAIRSDYTTAWDGYRNFVGGITKVEIPETVTEIGDYAFLGFKFEEITIPDSVIIIGKGAFFGCTNLANITLSNNLKSIGDNAFGSLYVDDPDCDKLTSIVLPDSIESIGNSAFAYCTNLASINFPEGLLTIGNYAFYRCNLGKVIIPSTVTSIGDKPFERACSNPIYCRVASKPEGWSSKWNYKYENSDDEDRYYNVEWSYTGE